MVSKKGLEILKKYYRVVEIEGDYTVAYIEENMKDYYKNDLEIVKYCNDLLYHEVIHLGGKK